MEQQRPAEERVDLKKMEGDVSSREAAMSWLYRRIKKFGYLLALVVVLAPIASGIVVTIFHYRRTKEIPPFGPLVVGSLQWSVIIIALALVVSGLIIWRYYKFAKRVRPIIESGTETSGEVKKVEFSSHRAKGINHYEEIVYVETSGDGTVKASLVESEGTPLPKVEKGAPAVVWSHEGKHVVGTSGALFESIHEEA